MERDNSNVLALVDPTTNKKLMGSQSQEFSSSGEEENGEAVDDK